MLLRRYHEQPPEVIKEAPVEVTGASFDELTVKQIKEQLDAKGIEYNQRAKKEELLALLK